MEYIKKFSFYFYVAIMLHLLGFIIFMPSQRAELNKLLRQLTKKRNIIRAPKVDNIIVESYQKSDKKPKITPFVSENFNPAQGKLTKERGYNVTEEPTPEKSNELNKDKVIQKNPSPQKDEVNPDLIFKNLQQSKPRLNIPRLKSKEHDRFIMNFDHAGKPSFHTRAFPNVKYFIKIAKTCWQYLVNFAPTNSISLGAISNSAVLVAFTLDRGGNIKKIWVYDSTGSNTLNSLSVRAIEFIKENLDGFGHQPPNYDIKVVYVYFGMERDFQQYGDERRLVPIKLKGAFYFEYKNLKQNKKRLSNK
jgi:hypothetical protein